VFEDLYIMSGGRLEIKLHEPGSIVAADGEWDAVQAGTLDGAVTNPTNNKKAFGPVGDIFVQFAGCPNPDAYMGWFYAGDGLKLEQELIDRTSGWDNVIVLGPIGFLNAENEMWSNREIQELADYEGLKIRTYGEWGKVLEDIGALPMYLPAGEVYQALERGVIDATELSGPFTDWTFGMHEVAKYVYEPGVHSPAQVADAIWNRTSYEALPDDLKLLLDYGLRKSAIDNMAVDTVKNAEAMIKIREYGTEVVTLPIEIQAYIVQAANDMWAAYAAEDEFYAKAYNSLMDFATMWEGVAGVIQPQTKMLLEYGK
jgi:TRAP-type mannitol/chloroaromatic compound transport system substrate-binding protein